MIYLQVGSQTSVMSTNTIHFEKKEKLVEEEEIDKKKVEKGDANGVSKIAAKGIWCIRYKHFFLLRAPWWWRSE